MDLNRELISKNQQNPAVGASIHRLAERVSELSGIEDPFAKELNTIAENITLDPELFKLIFGKMIESTEDLNAYKVFDKTSKYLKKIAEQILIDQINENHLSIVDAGIKDTDTLIAFVKTHGVYLRYLDFTQFEGQITKTDLQTIIESCPNLDHLILDNLMLNSDDLKFLQNYKGLKTLTFNNCRNLKFSSLTQ